MIEADDDKTNGMPFYVHLKDNQKVKNKKRWSQVMYMNYVINYRAEKDGLDLDNTFILTTDADIDFKAESAIVLLDMLACDFHVGAVSSRTHPKGYGPLYWYDQTNIIFCYCLCSGESEWRQPGDKEHKVTLRWRTIICYCLLHYGSMGGN